MGTLVSRRAVSRGTSVLHEFPREKKREYIFTCTLPDMRKTERARRQGGRMYVRNTVVGRR